MRFPEPNKEGKIDLTTDEYGHPRYDFRDGVQLKHAPTRGWKHETIYGNGGGVWLAYDADRGRVFYYSSPL